MHDSLEENLGGHLRAKPAHVAGTHYRAAVRVAHTVHVAHAAAQLAATLQQLLYLRMPLSLSRR